MMMDWTDQGNREGCPRQREEYMQRSLRLKKVWTVGGITERSVWPESSEQGREQCHGRLVKKVKLDPMGQSPS